MVQKIIFLFFIFLVTACSKKIDYIVVASSTEDRNETYITDIKFDDSWSVISGIVSCCWGWGSGTTGFYDVEPPESVYIQWYDFEQGVYYGGSMELSDKLYEYATELPYSYRGVDKRMSDKKYPYLFINVAKAGEVVAWISNSPRDMNYTIRVMHEVGRMQAEVLPIPPRGE